MTVYVTNFCTNPSFEVDLTGWTGLSGTAITQDNTYSRWGQQAMLVATPGAAVGEGFTGPVATNGGGATTGAATLYFLSPTGASGSVLAEVVDPVHGTVLGSTTVTLDGTGLWDTRAEIDFSLTSGQSYQLVVSTATVQALTFWADGGQYETGVAKASPYIDGDQPGCVWTGTPGESTSELLYPNATSARGSLSLSGRATPVVVGQAATTSASGSMKLSGDLQLGSQEPVAAFTDFAIFGLTDPDPAQTYADQSNAGASTGHTSYAQSYGIFVPPLDYPVSNGKFAWRRAVYAGVGFYFTGVPNNVEQNITQVQVGLAPLGSLTPVAFTPPRELTEIIKPTRLNWCTNPSFEVSTAGWSGVGTGTVAQDSTNVPAAEYDTLQMLGNLNGFYANTGITSDGSTGFGGFGGSGSSGLSYSAQQLALAGFGIGQVVTSGGIEYAMPMTAANTPDNIMCQGQVIPVTAVPDASLLGFLGAAVNGGTGGLSGTVTVTYADGSTDTLTLGLSDWTLDGDTVAPSFGNQVAVSMPYQNVANGTSNAIATFMFSAALPVNATKTITSITLPNVPNMRIFGISMASEVGNTFGSFSGKVAVHASGDGVKISIPDLIVGDTYTVSFGGVQAGPGLASLTATMGAAIPGDAGSGSVTIAGAAGANVTTGVWFTPSFSFMATSSTAQVLQITAATGTGFSSPSEFWVDAVLIEDGEIARPYFDGSFGSSDYNDYQWESGGTAGLTRSYYYQQFTVKKFTISETLAQHVPLGISAAAPAYLQPYTQ